MTSFTVENSVAFVTGSNKANGIGRAIVNALLEHDWRKKGLCHCTEGRATPGKVVAIPLDVTDNSTIEQLPTKNPDVTFLVNNAGYFAVNNSSLGDVDLTRKEIEINYLAPMALVKAFGSHWKKEHDNSSKDCGCQYQCHY